jgi:hypothetical protein
MEITGFFSETKSVFIVVHIVSVIVGMGAALISDAFFTLFSRDKVLEVRELKILHILSKIVWTGLALIIISGLGIFLSDPIRYAASAKFLSKMSVVLILAINGYVLHRYIKPHLGLKAFLSENKGYLPRKIAFCCGAISLVSWLYACTLALLKNIPWNYAQIMGIYVLILVIAIPCALFIEHRKFSRT